MKNKNSANPIRTAARKATAAKKAAPKRNKLNPAEVKALGLCRSKLQRGLAAMAEALATILERRLYRADYTSFELFVRAECGLSKAYAHRLVQAHTILRSSTFVDTAKPVNIAQAIALGGAPSAQFPQVMRRAAELAGESKISAKLIRKAVDSVAPRPAARPRGVAAVKIAEPAATPIKTEDALAWVRELREMIPDGTKLQAALALVDLIELALRREPQQAGGQPAIAAAA